VRNMSETDAGGDKDIMRPLRLLYLKDLVERQDLLNSYLEKLHQGSFEEADRVALMQLVHKLTGTGATYGYPQISETASLLEELLRDETLAPIDLLTFDLNNLLEACTCAHEQEPVSFSTPSSQPAPMESAVAPSVAKPKQPTVLIVDDDENVRSILGTIVQEFAHVVMGTSAQEALELMQSEHPDLVLLDDRMPGATSGMKLLEDIQHMEALKSIPIIMITASDQPEAVIRGLTAGAADYIIKPFDPKSVGDKIKTRLKRLGITILIVDDDVSICDLLDRKFTAAGFITSLAENGQKALDMMRAEPPDLVLLDRMLPGLDGMTVLQMMRETPALEATPVIFLTARRQEADILDGFALGASDYIVKPFNPDEVIVRCTRLLGSSLNVAA